MRRRPVITPGTGFCRVKEAAAIWGVSTETVYRACQRGEVMVKRVGKLLLLSRPDVERATAMEPERVRRAG